MPGKLSIVSKGCSVSDLAVVCDVHIGHDPVIVTHPGNADILCRTEIKRTKLADSISIADFKSSRLTRVFFVLRHFTN